MPIMNLGRVQTGSVYIDRAVQAPQWTPIPVYTSAEGGDSITVAVRNYLRGDIATVATHGSFPSARFGISGSNLDMVITLNPRPSVADGEQVQDKLTLRATGVSPGAGVTPTADTTITIVTFDVPDEKIFWTGSPGRSINEGQTITIPLAQYVGGTPDAEFDSIAIGKNPNVDWITLENPTAANAQLKVVAPEVSENQNVVVTGTVRKATANPTSDVTQWVITVLNLEIPTEGQGINVLRWDIPQGIIRAGTFQVAVIFDGPLQASDSLTVADFYVDGLDGVTITSVDEDDSNANRYILSCTARTNITGIATFGLVKS